MAASNVDKYGQCGAPVNIAGEPSGRCTYEPGHTGGHAVIGLFVGAANPCPGAQPHCGHPDCDPHAHCSAYAELCDGSGYIPRGPGIEAPADGTPVELSSGKPSGAWEPGPPSPWLWREAPFTNITEPVPPRPALFGRQSDESNVPELFGERPIVALLMAEPYCHGGRDGDCTWRLCPQQREGEPTRSGRHCPLDMREPDEGETPLRPPVRVLAAVAHGFEGDAEAEAYARDRLDRREASALEAANRRAGRRIELPPLNMTAPHWWGPYQAWLQAQQRQYGSDLRKMGDGYDVAQLAYQAGWDARGEQTEVEAAVDGRVLVRGPYPLVSPLLELYAERDRQRAEYGDEHDESHSWAEWLNLIQTAVMALDRAIDADRQPERDVYGPPQTRGRVVQLAALCYAALEAQDRVMRREVTGGLPVVETCGACGGRGQRVMYGHGGKCDTCRGTGHRYAGRVRAEQ